MSNNRMYYLFVVIALAAVIAFTARAALATSGSAYHQSAEQVLREYQLGERYGETPPHVAQFSAEQIRREYILGERYGVTPQGYAEQQALREYWLGERYGQIP